MIRKSFLNKYLWEKLDFVFATINTVDFRSHLPTLNQRIGISLINLPIKIHRL